MNLRTSEVAKRIFSYGTSNVACSFGPLATRLQALRDYARRLDQTDQAYALLGSVLTADSDIVSDNILDMPLVNNQVSTLYTDISEDTFDLIDQGLSDVANILENADSQTAPGIITIVDGDGISYKLQRVTSSTPAPGTESWMQLVYRDGFTETIPFITSYIEDGVKKWRFNNIVHSMNGDRFQKTITSWLNSLSISSTINSITNAVINLCVKGRATVSSIYSAVSQFTSSKISSIKQWAMTFVNIFNESGLSGVVNYILRSLAKVGSGLFDNDGAMAFTDNTLLVPKEFIGSLLSTIATTVGTMLLAFAGVVGKIIGAALTVAGGIISWFSKTAWGQYNSETKAGLVDTDLGGETTVLPEAPYAMCQFEFMTNSFDSLLADNSGIIILNVPGGLVHIGPSATEGYVRFEFHPHAFWTFNDITCDYFGAIPKGSGANSNAYFAVPRISLNVSGIETLWNNGYDVGSSYSMTNNWSSDGAQVFSTDSDIKLRRVVARNTGLFLLWLSAINLLYSEASGYSIPISRSSSTYPHYAYQLSSQGASVGWGGNNINNFVVYAFIPIAGTFFPKYGIDGSDMSIATATAPSWTQLGNSFVDINATTELSASYVKGATFPGNTVVADYYISSGIWYPQYGANFLTANHSDLGLVQRFNIIQGVVSACNHNDFLGDADFVQTQISSGVYTPKYNRETFWLWIGAMAAVTAIAAVAIVVASVKIKKAIKMKRASNAAKVESAWTNLVNNPQSAQAQEAYYKAAKKANLWSKVIGGTSFDTSNYWSGGSDDVEPTAGKLMNYIAGEDTAQSMQELLTDNFDVTGSIKRLIKAS